MSISIFGGFSSNKNCCKLEKFAGNIGPLRSGPNNTAYYIIITSILSGQKKILWIPNCVAINIKKGNYSAKNLNLRRRFAKLVFNSTKNVKLFGCVSQSGFQGPLG